MKKFLNLLCVIIVLITVMAFGGCNVEEPKVWASDNPDIMMFSGTVPKPDSILLYNNGKEKELISDTTGFNEFWIALNNLVNGRVKTAPIDSLYDSDRITEIKRTETCFEILYNKIYKQENSSKMFNGLFFRFETYNLIYGYYRVDENGEYFTTVDGESYFTDFYSISYSGNSSKIDKIYDLIDTV